MPRTGVMFALVLALGMGLGWFGHQHLSAQQAPVTRTVLLQTDVAGVEGKEAVLVVAEIAPGATTGNIGTQGRSLPMSLRAPCAWSRTGSRRSP